MFLLLTALPLSAQTATNELSTLVPAYGEIPPTFWEQHETPILVGGFAFLAIAFLFLRVMLRPEKPVILPPEVLARQALAKLQRQPEDGKALSEVSQILRRYISVAFELPAAELTTAEFCTALAANEQIGTEAATSISSFLRECDERKFSPAVRSSTFTRPGPPEGGTPNLLPPINTSTRALELISLAEAHRLRAAPVPGAANSQAQEAAANQQTQQSSDTAASGDGRAPQ
jgi:hypothetical protein